MTQEEQPLRTKRAVRATFGAAEKIEDMFHILFTATPTCKKSAFVPSNGKSRRSHTRSLPANMDATVTELKRRDIATVGRGVSPLVWP